jgi:hypothetical protein
LIYYSQKIKSITKIEIVIKLNLSEPLEKYKNRYSKTSFSSTHDAISGFDLFFDVSTLGFALGRRRVHTDSTKGHWYVIKISHFQFRQFNYYRSTYYIG